MKFAILLIATLPCCAQLRPPQLGVMIDRDGAARPVLGVASSVTTGNPLATAVIDAACSSQLCLFKTQSSILWTGGQTPAPAGPAIFALNGLSAFVYFPRSRQLAQWQNGALTTLNLPVTGEILSLAALADGTLQFAVLRDAAVSILDQNGSVLGSLPSAPAILLNNGAVYATSDTLILRRSDASELRWPLSGIQGFSPLGDGYLQIRTASGPYALRVIAGREQLFMLPETAR